KRVACSGLKGANATLAENHIHVALAEDVFRAHDQIVDCGAESPLEQDRQPAAAHLFQEREVVHVESSDLETVSVFFDHGEIARVHDFADYRQARFRAGFGKKPKAVLT